MFQKNIIKTAKFIQITLVIPTNFIYGNLLNSFCMKNSLVFVSISFLILFTSCDFTRTKKLYGTNFELMDGIVPFVELCYSTGRNSSVGVLDLDETPEQNDIKSVYWNKQYILAYSVSQITDSIVAYYIVEQLPTDTLIFGVPWTTYNSEPYTYEKYTDYDSFCQRLQQLDIDTTKMRHYKWKYVLGIY